MMRKCIVGRDNKPAIFHGWFQFGNATDGMDGMAIVEYEDGKTDYFEPGYITFTDGAKNTEQLLQPDFAG
jgi:hypothetical protein